MMCENGIATELNMMCENGIATEHDVFRTSATEELGPMNSEKYGVEVHGSWMTFKAAYSEVLQVF